MDIVEQFNILLDFFSPNQQMNLMFCCLNLLSES